MVCTLVLAVEMHGKKVVKNLKYHGNSRFALQLPADEPPPPPRLVYVVEAQVQGGELHAVQKVAGKHFKGDSCHQSTVDRHEGLQARQMFILH